MFKIILLGDALTGKTRFLNSSSNNVKIKYETNYGLVVFDCWEDSRNYSFADACFIFHNLLHPETGENVLRWEQEIKYKCGYLPIFTIGTHADHPIKKTHWQRNHFEIAQDQKEKDAIFLQLAKLLMGRPDLEIKN